MKSYVKDLETEIKELQAKLTLYRDGLYYAIGYTSGSGYTPKGDDILKDKIEKGVPGLKLTRWDRDND